MGPARSVPRPHLGDRVTPRKPRPRGRPAASAEHVAARVAAYCQRYGVQASADGLPPFPSGQRETAQHRQWLVVYRAVKRLAVRREADANGRPARSASSCAVCLRSLPHDDVLEVRMARGRTVPLHSTCAELAGLAIQAGPEATARLAALLWPMRAPRR
jgi:hypothetical protein